MKNDSVLKKEFKHRDVERLRNLVQGKYGDKTTMGTGYQKAKEFHNEGDIWEENGKTWTIKNGIKQTISKLDEARKASLIPLACPECNKALKHYLDKNAWKTTKKCFDCNIKEETQMRLNGTFDEHVKEVYRKNAMAWLEDKRIQFEDFINNPESLRGFITERGDIEDWYGSPDRTSLIEQFEKEYAELKEKIENV